MKIVHVLAYYGDYYGGIQHSVNQISLKQRDLGHDVKIITSDRFSKSSSVDNVQVCRLNAPIVMFRVPFMPKLLPTLLCEDYDVLSVFLPFPSLDVCAALTKALHPNKKLVVSIRNPLPDPANFWMRLASFVHDKWSITKALDVCDAVLFTTKEFPESLPYAIPRDKMFIVPNGVDTTLFCPSVDYSFDENQLLFVGRIIPEKGLDILVRAVKLVREDFPDVKLVAVGSSYYGHLEYLRKILAEGEGFLTYRYNVPSEILAKLYRESAVLVLPSIGLESFGNVLMEAMASGSPVICTNLPGPSSVVSSGSQVPVGRTFSNGDVAELSKAIKEELANNDKIRRRKIREFALSKASWNSVAETLIKIYERCEK